ncbi:hypothetical protein J4423_05375 [Candidatus Pacearchaeota archaeon]|nr:hypothetical protein [Candidatus Pacearchaeota archaeon]
MVVFGSFIFPGLIFGIGVLVILKDWGFKNTRGGVLWLFLCTLAYFFAAIISTSQFFGMHRNFDFDPGVGIYSTLVGSMVGIIIMVSAFALFSFRNNKKMKIIEIGLAVVVGMLLIIVAIITLTGLFGDNKDVVRIEEQYSDIVLRADGGGYATISGSLKSISATSTMISTVLIYQTGMMMYLGWLMLKRREDSKDSNSLKSKFSK